MMWLVLAALVAAAPGRASDAIPAAGEESEVLRVVAEELNREASRPYDYLFHRTDFESSANIAASMDNPDRTEFCGLSRDAAQTLLDELELLSARPLAIDRSVAKQIGLKLGQKRHERFRYLTLSRVVFDRERRTAWLAVDLDGSSGAIVRLDKVDGAWSRTARCAGWVKAVF